MTIQTVKQINGEDNQITGYLVNGSIYVPNAEGNRHYQMVQEWIAEGNTPEPADVPPEPTYREKRAAEYPPVGDQLDALFHAGVFPDWMADKLQAVKNKYPKEAIK